MDTWRITKYYDLFIRNKEKVLIIRRQLTQKELIDYINFFSELRLHTTALNNMVIEIV